MPQCRVAVVVPAFRSAAYLPFTLGSLEASVEQPLEVVVVDDGSPDDDAAVAETFRDRLPGLTVLRQANGGVASARNAGLRASHAPYVLFLDGDDAVTPDLLGALADGLDAAPEAAAAYANLEHFEVAPDGTVTGICARPHGAGTAEEQLLHGRCPMLPSATLVRRSSAVAVGGFREGFLAAEDYDFFVRLLLHAGPYVRVPGVTGMHRRVAGQRSTHHVAIGGDMLRTLEAALATLPRDDARRGALRERLRFLRLVHAGVLDREGRPGDARRAVLRALPFPPRPGHVLEALGLLRRPSRVLERVRSQAADG